MNSRARALAENHAKLAWFFFRSKRDFACARYPRGVKRAGGKVSNAARFAAKPRAALSRRLWGEVRYRVRRKNRTVRNCGRAFSRRPPKNAAFQHFPRARTVFSPPGDLPYTRGGVPIGGNGGQESPTHTPTLPNRNHKKRGKRVGHGDTAACATVAVSRRA